MSYLFPAFVATISLPLAVMTVTFILEFPDFSKSRHEQLYCRMLHGVIHGSVLLQPFYGSLDFVRDNPGEPVPEETFTHSHLSWSSIIPYLLPPSIMIHSILRVQFTCLTVFFHNIQVCFGLPLGLAPSTYTPYILSPNHCLLFAAHAHVPLQPVLL